MTYKNNFYCDITPPPEIDENNQDDDEIEYEWNDNGLNYQLLSNSYFYHISLIYLIIFLLNICIN